MKVSVIVPAYNAEKYITQTLEALTVQTYPDMEVILIDDGSTDGTPEIMDAFANRFDYVEAYHIENGGVYHARLEGIRLAKGDYVAFCDGDDLYLPEMIEKMAGKAEETSADMVVCGFVREEMDTQRILSREMLSFDDRVFSLDTHAYILPVINTAVWNKLIRRGIAEHAIVFQEAPRVLEDMMFLCSLYPIMKSIAFLPEILYRYRVHSDGAMSHVEKKEMRLLKKNMVETRQYVLMNSDNPEIHYSCDSMAFIHFGLSVVIRQAQNGENIGEAVRQAREYLETYFPGYKRTGIGLWWNLRHHMMLIKPLLARWFFCAGLMRPALTVYNFITQKLKIEIKW